MIEKSETLDATFKIWQSYDVYKLVPCCFFFFTSVLVPIPRDTFASHGRHRHMLVLYASGHAKLCFQKDCGLWFNYIFP